MTVQNLIEFNQQQNPNWNIYSEVFTLHKEISRLSELLIKFEAENLPAETLSAHLADLLVRVFGLGKYWNLNFAVAYEQMIKESEFFIERNKAYARIGK